MRAIIPCFLLLVLLYSSVSYAATVHGTVYDLSLEKVANAIVEVNSSPRQRMIAQDGEYSFVLSNGAYQITARQLHGNLTVANASETIDIVEDSTYVLDLFLYPTMPDDIMPTNETIIDLPPVDEHTTNYLLAGILFLLAALLVAAFFIYRRMHQPRQEKEIVLVGDDTEKIIQILRAEGGRTTQKDIRKHFPLSEAKVSLLITELESKGVIDKIKKGRGNVIILKR